MCVCVLICYRPSKHRVSVFSTTTHYNGNCYGDCFKRLASLTSLDSPAIVKSDFGERSQTTKAPCMYLRVHARVGAAVNKRVTLETPHAN